MTFPQTPLDMTVELELAGTWTDITGYVYTRDGLDITRGRADEAAQVDRSTARMTLDNRDGRFTPRNPLGAYYGLLGRNTPLRVAVKRGATRLDLPGAVGDKVTAPDATALGITGDIDIRIDISMQDWTLRDLCGKYETTGDQRSWVLQTRFDGCLNFSWSSAGTFATLLTAESTAPIPLYPRRQALRVTLDVNNGAAGKTVTFYTADTNAGPWTQLGDAVTTAGTTSVFDGTGVLEVGDVGDLTALQGWVDISTTPVRGSVHAFELRSSIGGTVVANPDFAAQSEGVTSFADTASSPNTWTVAGGASLTNRRWRFHGEVSSWPVNWDPSGNDVYVQIEASGILRRLGQGAPALKSTIYRSLLSLTAAENRPFAYWPMEDESGSTFMAPAIGGMRMNITGGEPSLAASSVFACSDSIVTCANGGFNGKVPAQRASTALQMRLLVGVPAAGMTDGAVVMRVWSTGTLRRWDVRYNTATSGSFTVLAYDRDLSLAHTGSASGGFNGKLLRLSLELTQDGSDVDYALGVDQVDTDGSLSAAGTVTSQTWGTATSVSIDPNLNMDDVTVGHLSIHPGVTDLLQITDEITGHVGETAGRRIERLCAEEGIAFTSIGDLDDTEMMGAQTPGTLLDLLRECVDADLGILFEPRDRLGIGYRTRDTLLNQTAGIALDVDAGELAEALDPLDDDQATRNDVTVSRKGGSSARYELTDGPLSTQPPPEGVGVYDESVTINIAGDTRLLQHAAWRVHEGTVDEARYPQIATNLAAPAMVADASLVEALMDVEFGDRLTVDNPPPELPPDQISQLVQGYAETIGPYEHRLDLNCSPETPWRVGVYAEDRYDTCGTELATAIGDPDTSVPVITTAGPYWTTDAANLPFDAKVGGERMTVSAITSAVTDAFGRTTASGWGSADSGQAWTATGGSAADFSVSGGFGRHSMATATNISRWTTIPAPSADFDFTATVATSVTPAGGSHFVYLAGRWADVNNNYIARIEFTTTSTVALTIRKRLAGTETSLGGGTVTGLTHGASTRFGVRFKAIGPILMAKVWLASGAEPAKWTAVFTDTDLVAAGSIGFRSILAAAVSNPLPVTATFDNLALLNPQTMTVTRGVNGVTKSHAAGAALSLADPAVPAL